MKLTFIGLLTALVILPGSVSGAEIYSVQVGIYQKIEFSPKGKYTTQGGRNNLPENPLEIRRAILWGTVLESSPLTGNPLGLVPEKEITRVMVRVDKSEAVKGYPNLLQDKETEEIILYSETRQPFFLPGQRIRALVEYQGDKYKRFFWIKQVEPIKP